jgi:phage tail-like protein
MMGPGAAAAFGLATASGAIASVSGATTGMGHHYSVQIDNGKYDFGSWSKVSGLSVSWEKCEYRVGEEGNEVYILPGTTKYEPIKLSRAACLDSQIVQSWLVATSQRPEPQSGTVQLVNFLGLPIIEWRLNEFFPVGWSISEFDASTGHTAIETLTLAHTGFLPDQMSPA